MTESLSRNAVTHKHAPVLFLLTVTLYALWLAQPQLIAASGSPANTDLGGHVVALRHLIDVSLPAGHLHDWSHQWFAGYPSFYFYFPLPALVIAALTLAVPLGVAAKLVAVVAPALLPLCTYALVRSAGFSQSHAAAGALAAVTSLSLTTQYTHGGNILSSVIGEYSYALGLCFAVLYLDRIARAARGPDESVALSVLLCLSALAHLVPTIVVVFVSCAFLGDRRLRRQVVTSWVVGFALSAFWSVPFLARMRYMSGLGWSWSVHLADVLPLPVLIMLPFTAAALFALRGRLAELRVLLLLAIVSLLLYLVPQDFTAQNRSLPIWYYAAYVVTGVGLAEGLRRVPVRSPRAILYATGLTMLLGVSLMQAELVRNRSAVLLASERHDSDSYERLIATLRTLPPGRIHWEEHGEPDDLLGSKVGLVRIPLHAPGYMSTYGMLFESALMTPVFLRLSGLVAAGEMQTAAAQMKALGVNYFVSFSAETAERITLQADELLKPLHSTHEWTLWDVHTAPLVETIDTAWPGSLEMTSGATVTGVELGHRRIRFTTTASGVPHLVRVAWFPNWRTDDATGPFLVAPGFMVVIPRGQDVELRFERTWVELAGLLLSLLGAVGLFVFNRRKDLRG